MPDSITRAPSAIANDDQRTLPYAIAAEEDRCAPRQRLAIPARMRFSCSSGFPVQVTDMSLAGFACDALTSAHPGTLCWLTLPGLGALEAEVVRHSNDGMGCAFKNLLNLAVLNHYVLKYPAKVITE
ncbi:PilZ domain-containing protein [Parasphingorhabdus sp.]|uniref:PilZ domain-containing protein n=1 Tax=Parasphingorhabdus sp. TaxID=2709688 RepID=UPI003C76DD1B